LIGNLGAATVVGDAALAERDFKIPFYAQPPECQDGRPTATSNNIWSIGAIFAEMTLRETALKDASLRIPQDRLDGAVGFKEVMVAIRAAFQDTFDIREDPDFDKLDSGVQEILPHLLDPNPRTRWTADEAIQRVEEVASQRGIAVPPQRQISELPACWRESWRKEW